MTWENLKSQIKEVKEKVEDSYFIWEVKDSFLCFFRSLRHMFFQLVRVIQYIPVIWKNEDWDYEYILDLLDYKLSRVEKRLTKFGSEEEVNQVRETRKHIKNYINYEEAYAKEVEAEPFEIDFDFRNNTFETINKVTGKVLTENEDKVYKEYLTRSYKWQGEEWDKIWDNFKEYLWHWWD